MDAYIKLLKHMQEQGSKNNPPSIQLGEMVNSNTLKIGDLQIDKSNLLIADYLLKDYKRKIKIPLVTATGITESQSVGEHGSHSHNVTSIGINDVEINFNDTLKTGDIVAVIPTNDMQIYIILARVVKV